MDRGIILISVGSQFYGQMAYNLALSIKKSENIPICILTDYVSLEKLEPNQKKYFDHYITPKYEHYHEDDILNPFKLKTYIYGYSPFKETLYLDVDSFFLYDYHNINDVFNNQGRSNFQIYEVNRYKKENAHTSAIVWTKPDKKEQLLPKLWDLYGLSPTAKYPEYNSSFIYFTRTQKNETYFNKVKECYDDRRHDFKDVGKAYPDELAWNLASAQLKHYGKIEKYNPIYFNWTNKIHNLEDHVAKKYFFWGMAGGYMPTRWTLTYNKLVKMARKSVGDMEPFEFNMLRKIYHRK